MNFDFDKFRVICNDINKVMDLRNKTDRKAFTAYMRENGIRHTDLGAQLSFVWFNGGTTVFGIDSVHPHTTIYSFYDFLLPELSVDDILDFLEV